MGTDAEEVEGTGKREEEVWVWMRVQALKKRVQVRGKNKVQMWGNK